MGGSALDEVEKWLHENRHDCYGVSEELKRAIANFVLVWSIFEHKVLSPASVRLHTEAIEEQKGYEKNYYDLIEDAARRGISDFSDSSAFQAAYAFHKERNYDGVQFSEHLEHLAAEGARANTRMREVFQNETALFPSKLAALLHVAYCLRTNLIHGYKWEDGLHGQEKNFYMAALVLMLAVDHSIPVEQST